METSWMGRCLSGILSRWTVLALMTIATLWGIHHRLTDLDHTAHTADHVAVIPSTSIR
jgi:hypothetical protein